MKKVLLGDPDVNLHVATILGIQYHHRDFYYEHDGERWAHFCGGVAWPTFQVPGYAVIVGIKSEDPNEIECLWEMESESTDELYQGCIKAQQDLGKIECPEICSEWWGNPERVMTMVNERNLSRSEGMLISPPADYDEPDAFEIYLAQLKMCLMTDNKIFRLNDSAILRGYLESFVSGEKVTESTHPAIAVAGWVVHTLLQYQPWQQAVVTHKLTPTDQHEYDEYQHNKAMEELMGGPWT